MKVLFVGDTHVNRPFLIRIHQQALDLGAEAIVQLGDFGYWPKSPQGQRFLDTASGFDLPLFFVDGNHEDHFALPHDTALSTTELAPGVHWLPRGSVFSLGDTTLLAFGGAVSVDQAWRIPGKSWFHNETASWTQRERALEVPDRIDIIVAHDAPTDTILSLTFPVTPQIDRACNEYRDFCRSLLDRHRPEVWFAGHYHQRATTVIDQSTVEVLDHDYGVFADSFLLRDL